MAVKAVKWMGTVAMCASVLFSGCSLSEPAGNSEPPSPAGNPTTSGGSESAKTPPPATDSMPGLEIVGSTQLALPGVGQTTVWFVRIPPTDVIGAIAEIDKNNVILRDPDPIKSGGLAGPEGPPVLSVVDLDGDGTMEVLLQGSSGQGKGVWVYRFDPTRLRFEAHGDQWGRNVTMRSDPDGKGVLFDVTEWERSSSGTTVRQIIRKWRPGGFVDGNTTQP